MKITALILMLCSHCLTNSDYSWLMSQAYFHQKMWKEKITSYLGKYPRLVQLVCQFYKTRSTPLTFSPFAPFVIEYFFFPKRNFILKQGHSNRPHNILDCQISQLFLISVMVWPKPQSWQLHVQQKLGYEFLFLRCG